MHIPRIRSARLALEALLAACVLAPGVAHAAGVPVPTPEGLEFFEKKVRPVLVEHCFKCHGGGKKKGGLSLETRSGLLVGGNLGPAVVPGQPDRSRLLEAVGYQNVELQMPPRGKLPDAAIKDLTEWVRLGAPAPADDTTAADRGPFHLEKRKREHWAWRPVRRVDPPAVRDAAWPRGDVDRFILARLEAEGLAPAGPADRRTWLRRVSFDLVGLPPAPEEIDAFLKDDAEDASAKAVDRLLASPHFGERWGRHWLDLVRYGESRGHEFDYHTPNAWQYRDYVLRAFNADVPYNQFVTEHLAGDLLPEPRRHPTEGFNESILGTGFWFLGEEVHSPVDVAADEADRFDNRIDVMTKTFLGLTVACARCHDHKFDAVSTKDYYSLYAILQSCGYRLARFDTCDRERRVAGELALLREKGRAAVGRALAEGARPVAGRLAEYLLAARGDNRRRDEIAGSRKPDAALAGRWANYLASAAQDAGDPFHAFARSAADERAADPKRLAELLRPPAEEERRRAAEAAEALKGSEIVVDYSRSRPEDWMTDGGAFGAGPVRPGMLRIGGTPDKPTLRVADRGAAEVDGAWPRLRPAPGSENDPGALGGLVRAGRTLRTPSFLVGPGRVFYLVRGSGLAYAAVHSHAMIAGPLNGQVLQGIQAGGWQWVGQDLTRYKGYRAHLEFTPRDGADFAVACVVQADRPPRFGGIVNPPLLDLLTRDTGSLEALAAGYQRAVREVVESLAEDRLTGGQAPLADWLVRHAELFDLDGGLTKRLAEAAGPVLAAEAKLLAEVRPESRLALAMLEGSGMDGHVFVRGSPKAHGEAVPRRFLEALAGPAPLPDARGSGRLDLARQMTDPALDPFLVRVMVNRVWHHLFGRGLVASVDNFGVLGERPSHPELLDHLADTFVKGGWSIKRLVRTLVLSRTYEMSSSPDGRGDALDPQDLLLHRMRVRRLEGEAIRDAMLAVSGRLDGRLFGPSVPVFLNDFQQGRGRPASGPLDGDGRRSVYLAVRRNFLSSFLLAFDTPIPFSTVGRRSVSNVPAQALILMNDPFVHQQAGVWARRTLAEAGTPRQRVETMYLRAFGRPASESECRRCLDFIGDGKDDPAAWADLAHVLYNAKDFIFLH